MQAIGRYMIMQTDGRRSQWVMKRIQWVMMGWDGRGREELGNDEEEEEVDGVVGIFVDEIGLALS